MFDNIVAVFGSVVKFCVKCFYYWISYQEETSSVVKEGGKWIRCRLTYYLVLRCRCCRGQSPKRLNGSTFLSPIYKKCRRWRRIGEQSIREVVDNEFPYCETSDKFKFKLDSGVPDANLSQLCDGQIKFLSAVDLIHNFEDNSVDHDYIIEVFFNSQLFLARLISLLIIIRVKYIQFCF